MINTWEFNLIIYIIFMIIFTQFYKLAANKGKSDGALTILIQVLSGIFGLIWIPFFKMQFSSNYITWGFLLISIVFYAIADRLNTTARRGLGASEFSILGQLVNVFTIVFGVVFFKEEVLLKKVIGTILILTGNVFVLFEKGKFKWNKYTIFSILGSLSMSIALIVDVGISDQFNLAVYAALTLSMPAIILLIGERIKIKDIIDEFKNGDKKSIIIVSFTWPITIITLLRAYKFGTVGTVAPISAVTTILNVFVAYFALKEKDNLLKKIFAAIIVVLGIVLIKI